MTKLEELKKMLDEVGIECEIKEPFLDCIINNEIQTPVSKNGIKMEVVYGYSPILTSFEKAKRMNCVPITIEQAFKRIKYCVENNTDTYVEEETFNVGENVLVPNTVTNNIIETKLTKRDLDYIKGKYYFASHSKRKCLEYLYIESHKRELKEQENKKDLLKQMEEEK